LRYVSVCSGIEAATVAWHPLGWKPALFAEIEKFPGAVLAHHYPEVKNVGDFTKIQADECGPIDALVGGTPCQDFSVAGLRAGLDGKRGQLTIEYAALAGRLRPRWLVWENVPGVLSSDGGRAFGTFLGILGQLGYGLAYRVLDAQYLGVPQRRRRVFVVGYFGDWRRAAAVLFERQSMSGHPPPSREARQVPPCIPSRSLGGGGLGTDFDCDGGLVVGGGIAHCLASHAAKGGDPTTDNYIATGGFPSSEVAPTLNAGGNRTGGNRQPGTSVDPVESLIVTHSLRADGFDASEDGTGCGTPLVAFDCKASGRNGFGVGETSPTLRAMGHAGTHQNAGGQVAVMTLAIRGRGDSHDLEYRQDGTANAVLTPNGGRAGIGVGAVAIPAIGWSEELTPSVEVAGTIQRGGDGGRHEGVMTPTMAVRRLTPRECERLQGFPDDYTRISRKTADGPRYKALGNSMAVPVMRWIGERIAGVDALQ